MSELRVHLFGVPRLERDGRPIKIDTWKALALLAYLVLNEQEHSREALAALFWPEQGETQARSSLRRALWTLRQAVAQDSLQGDKQTVRFRAPADMVVDVVQFQGLVAGSTHAPDRAAHLQMEKLQLAVTLYRADFLVGMTLPDCPAFDEWQFFTAERLRRNLAQVLQRLIDWHIDREDYLAAAESARRWLALDPLHEPVHRQLMQLYAWSGQTAAAVRQYEECKRLFAKELDAPPDAETTQLYSAILSRRFARPAPHADRPMQPARAAPPMAFPPSVTNPSTALIGRDQELADLDQLMFAHGERLVTITGPGGMGKTSLALAVAERHVADRRFGAGVCFVSFEGIEQAQAILPILANALGLQSEDNQATAATRRRQMLDFLADKHMLLIFDNFEQVIEGRTLVGDIYTATTAVHLLVTARERLHLHNEQVYPIGGLACPTSVEEGDVPALALFLRTARRTHPHFRPDIQEQMSLIRICQLVAGMPLALELAAGWVHLLSLTAILAELQGSLDLLTTTSADAPVRHRSIRAAFDVTWALLTEAERRIFAQLCVFSGGFTRHAALQMTDVTLAQLMVFVDKSLLGYHSAADRYSIHELLRQYGAEKLAGSGGYEQARLRHVDYYLGLAERNESALRDAPRSVEVKQMAYEHSNLQAALQWACRSGAVDRALRLAGALLWYWHGRGDWIEGAQALETVLALRPDGTPADDDRRLYAKVLYAAGFVAWHQADYARAQSRAVESLRLYRAIEDDQGAATVLHLMGLTARAQRDFAQALSWFSQSLALSRQLGDGRLTATVLSDMGRIAWRQNEFEKAKQLFEESLALHQAAQDLSGEALNLHRLGLVAYWQGDLALATTLSIRSLAAFRQLEDSAYTAACLSCLGTIALRQNELEQAQRLFEQAQAIFQGLGARRDIASIQLELGHVWRLRGNHALACRLYAQATTVLRSIGDRLRLILVLEAWAMIATSQGQPETAARLFGAIEQFRTSLVTPRPPVEIPEYAHQLAVLTNALDVSHLRREWATGRDLSLDQALDMAYLAHQTAFHPDP